ncbi:MAG TPA: VWA domain-containing protein [Pyrinomonadaceae bacterium]|nr:VWA domain-containing protein [Pyrinomonadaceae bacterium]
MKRLRRTLIQTAILSSLAFVLLSSNTSPGLAQLKEEAVAQAPSSRRGADPVTLTVTVTDRRRNYVKGLTQANFTVSDGKQEQQIKTFSADEMPLSVGILLDTSMSVGKANLKPIREALGRFFQLSEKQNEYFMIGFDTRPKLLQDWTSDAESILKQIDTVRPIGATALYDACLVSLEKVARGRHQKHVLLLISDGQDSISESSFIEVRRLLEESGVLLYSIASASIAAQSSSLALEGQAVLEELSTITGGAVFYPDGVKQANAVFDMLAIELRNQYSLSFTPTATDGKRHSLKVRVTPPTDAAGEMQNLTVRNRKSFYAKMSQP